MKNINPFLLVVIAAAVGSGIYEWRQAARLREQSRTLQQHQTLLTEQIEQLQQSLGAASNHLSVLSLMRTSAPPAQVSVVTNRVAAGWSFRTSNLYALLTNKTAKLTAAQVEPYLVANKRSAPSLLAAFRTTGDTGLLA